MMGLVMMMMLLLLMLLLVLVLVLSLSTMLGHCHRVSLLPYFLALRVNVDSLAVRSLRYRRLVPVTHR